MEIAKKNRGRILPSFPQLCIDKLEFTTEMDSTTFVVTHYDNDTLNEILKIQLLEQLGDISKSHCLYMHRIVFSLLKYWTTTQLYENEDMDGDEVVDKLEQLVENGKIRFLEVNVPVQLQPESSSNSSPVVQLTPLPSGSLAGCVMLLLEANDIRILYTGACRLTLKDLHSCQSLHNLDGSVKKIDKIYLDTTYCLDDVKELPSRSRTLKELAKLITKQIELDEDEQKQFEFPELEFNHLFCLRQLAESTQQKIHVPFELAEFLESINRSYSQFVTDEAGKKTHIHYDCAQNVDDEDCSPNGKDFEASPIKLTCNLKSLFGTGMIGTNKPTIDQTQIQKGNAIYCTPWAKTEILHGIYSNHLSLNEMGRMLNYLYVKPSNVLPLFLMEDMTIDDIGLGLEYACDALDEPAEIAEELPSQYFDFTANA